MAVDGSSAETTRARGALSEPSRSEAQARRMAETLPNGELVPVPGVGHAPILTEPSAISAIARALGG